MSNELIQPRKVLAFSTRGNSMTQIESSASTWSQLKSELRLAGYDMSTLIATEKYTRHTLEHDESTLPTGDFVLFLRPAKTKSGADYSNASYQDMRAEIAQIGKEVKDFLTNRFDTNWTRITLAQLREGLTAYHKVGNVASAKPQPVARPTQAPKSEASKDASKKNSASVNEVGSVVDSIKAALSQASQYLSDHLYLFSGKETDLADDVVDTIYAFVNGVGVSAAPKELTEAEKQQQLREQLAREAAELMKGF